MACKRSELISAINSFVNARLTNDGNLLGFSGKLLDTVIDTLEFEPEEEETKEKAE